MSAERATTGEELRATVARLHTEASTPEDICKLMQFRGRPRLGMLLLTYRTMRAATAVRECELKAELLRAGVTCGGWFEDGERPTDAEPRERIAKAFDWAATAFRRWALIQPADVPHVEPVIERDAPRDKRGPRATWKGSAGR